MTQAVDYSQCRCGEEDTCWQCDGEGLLLTCIDDMCRGAGECMHGDGYSECPECDGTGYIDLACPIHGGTSDG